jgi:hypothetical protein
MWTSWTPIENPFYVLGFALGGMILSIYQVYLDCIAKNQRGAIVWRALHVDSVLVFVSLLVCCVPVILGPESQIRFLINSSCFDLACVGLVFGAAWYANFFLQTAFKALKVNYGGCTKRAAVALVVFAFLVCVFYNVAVAFLFVEYGRLIWKAKLVFWLVMEALILFSLCIAWILIHRALMQLDSIGPAYAESLIYVRRCLICLAILIIAWVFYQCYNLVYEPYRNEPLWVDGQAWGSMSYLYILLFCNFFMVIHSWIPMDEGLPRGGAPSRSEPVCCTFENTSVSNKLGI